MEKQTKQAMEKPLSLKIEVAKNEIRQTIAYTAQANKLPYFIMEQVIESLLLEVKNMSKSDLQQDVSMLINTYETEYVQNAEDSDQDG